jgi:ABC-type lipoprotein export system ATPase subunit
MATETKPKRTRKKAEAPAQPGRFRINEVVLKGFKCFKDEFRFAIPPPEAADDLDVIVIGGPNGSGKTALLEGIALAMLVGMRRPSLGTRWHGVRGYTLDERKGELPPDWSLRPFVNMGKEKASGEFRVTLPHREDQPVSAGWSRMYFELNRDGDFYTQADPEVGAAIYRGQDDLPPLLGRPDTAEVAEGFAALVEQGADPLVCPPLLFFHSYRRVPQRDPELLDLGGRSPAPSSSEDAAPANWFKRDVSNALIAEKDLIEGYSVADSAGDLQRLSGLLEAFAGARLVKMAQAGNALGLRVHLAAEGYTLPFDYLSSGQKEIISTLFLIWRHTRDCQSVVLIDEPELYLNESWHNDFVWQLKALAPWNQYIIATHSQRIAESVDPSRLRYIEV